MDRGIKSLQSLVSFVHQVYTRFREDRCFRVASALSFTTLLAIVPLVTVIFSMLSLFPVFEQWSGAVEGFLFQNFVPAAGDTVKDYLHEFSSKAGKLTAVGLGILMLSTLLLLATIEDAFNDIWRVHRGRVLFQRLLVYWAVITLGPLMITISLSMSSTLLSLKIFTDQSLLAGATKLILGYLPFLFELGAYVLFYKAIPNRDVKIGHALIGALVATLLFEAAKYGFAYYILNFRSYEVIYGALSTIPIFIIWVYLCWIVMLVGAEVTATLGREEAVRERDLTNG